MWLCLSKGYLSIVKDKTDSRFYLVRARAKEHITEYFDIEPERFTGTDYVYRIRITANELMDFMFDRAEDIDYTNFKNTVKDVALKQFYSNVWLKSFALESDEDYQEYLDRYYDEKYSSEEESTYWVS